MTRTIVGLFDTSSDAHRAVEDLISQGFRREEISLIVRDADTGGVREHEVNAEGTTAEAAGTGAIGGGILGGTLGLLVGAGLLAIPGIGPVLAAGPLAAAIGTATAAVGAAAVGAGVGAATGGLLGGLVGAGIPEEHATAYVEGVRRGGTLVSVASDDSMGDTAYDTLRRHGAVDIAHRGAEWRASGWTPGADDTTNYANKPGSADNAWTESSKVGTAAGTLSGAATGAAVGSVGGPVGTVIGGVAGAAVGAGVGAAADVAGERSLPSDDYRGVNDYQDTPGRVSTPAPHADEDFPSSATSSTVPTSPMSPTSYDQYESDFRSHYLSSAYDASRPYDYYEPAYRFGYDAAGNPRYTGDSWNIVEGNARADWERDHPNTWESFKNSVRYAWEKARGLH